jgi:hypothetical protein
MPGRGMWILGYCGIEKQQVGGPAGQHVGQRRFAPAPFTVLISGSNGTPYLKRDRHPVRLGYDRSVNEHIGVSDLYVQCGN